MKHLEEDFEHLKEHDKMYLIEAHERMIEEWMEWTEYQERLPAEIVVKVKKHQTKKV